MIAYQTDKSGVLVGAVKLDRDPLEQDKWLIPAGAFTDEPPIVGDRQFARHDGTTWVIEDLPPEPDPPPPPVPAKVTPEPDVLLAAIAALEARLAALEP